MEAAATAGIHSCDLFLPSIPPPGPHGGDQVSFDLNLGVERPWKPPGTGRNVGLMYLVERNLALSCMKSFSSFAIPHQRWGGMSPCYFRMQEIVKRSRCTGKRRQAEQAISSHCFLAWEEWGGWPLSSFILWKGVAKIIEQSQQRAAR